MAAPIGEIIAGAVEGTFNSGINLWNTIQQQQKFDYDKAIQQQIFQREDTAVQRRMADLQAAGLNPQLAAGSGAGAGSVVSTQAPQMKNIDIGAALDTATAIERIKQAKQETENLKNKVNFLIVRIKKLLLMLLYLSLMLSIYGMRMIIYLVLIGNRIMVGYIKI